MSQNDQLSQADESRELVQAQNSRELSSGALEMLNPKQQQFVLEYTIDFNATQAAIRAGYSVKTAGAKGHELLKIVEIQKAISDQVHELQERTKVNAEYILNLLKDDVEADIADLYNEDNTFKHPKEWPLVWRRGLISGIEIETVQIGVDDKPDVVVSKVKLADRTKLKELLGKHRAVQAFDKEKEGNEIYIHIEGKDALL